MGKHSYQDGRNDAADGKYNPPDHPVGEFLSHETNKLYDKERADYKQGYEDMKHQIEHEKHK